MRKRQRRFEGFDDKILALYSRGLSTRDIEAHLEEIYGVKVGRDLISRVTDAVMEDARAWQTRPLDDVYPVVFLDALVLKIRDGGSVQRKACYLALGDHDRRRPRGARHVVPGQRGREVLDAGAHRPEDPRRQRHPDLLRRRPQGLPRSDRGGLPAHDGADVHRAPDPPEPALRPAPPVRPGRQRPQADLHRRRRRRGAWPRSRRSRRNGAASCR